MGGLAGTSSHNSSNSPSTHDLVEIRKSQGSPSKGPFAITTYARVRASTNVLSGSIANENSSSFENSQEMLRKVSKNLKLKYL